MRIGVDIMGGDFAPDAIIKGAILAHEAYGETCKQILIGDKEITEKLLNEAGIAPELFEIVHAPDVIKMSSSPVRSFAEKPNSSIAVGFDLLKSGEIDGFCSAGNTGAMLVGSVLKIGVIREDLRPCLMTTLPKLDGPDGIILDAGANADCKPENLLDFALLGSTYAEAVLKINNPRIGLVNIGEEPEKGNQMSIGAYKLLEAEKSLNFIGNIEGRDIFNSTSDVAVCSGFVGNVILKLSEKFYEIALRKGHKNDPFYDKFNYEYHGGSPVLGVKKPVVVGHGNSSPVAIKNMIRLTKEIIETELTEKIKLSVQHA